jgi:hypothetical protein
VLELLRPPIFSFSLWKSWAECHMIYTIMQLRVKLNFYLIFKKQFVDPCVNTLNICVNNIDLYSFHSSHKIRITPLFVPQYLLHLSYIYPSLLYLPLSLSLSLFSSLSHSHSHTHCLFPYYNLLSLSPPYTFYPTICLPLSPSHCLKHSLSTSPLFLPLSLPQS